MQRGEGRSVPDLPKCWSPNCCWNFCFTSYARDRAGFKFWTINAQSLYYQVSSSIFPKSQTRKALQNKHNDGYSSNIQPDNFHNTKISRHESHRDNLIDVHSHRTDSGSIELGYLKFYGLLSSCIYLYRTKRCKKSLVLVADDGQVFDRIPVRLFYFTYFYFILF